MPSERFLRFARSQGLGFVCGQATVLLLAVGSVVLAVTREGASSGIVLDEVGVFFERPSLWHAWFYLLLGVMTVYGANTFLATWHSVSRKWRTGVRRMSAYAPSVVHLAFLMALLAHLVGGLRSEELDPVVFDETWSELEPGVDVRVLELTSDRHPDGALRQVTALAEVREGEGVERVELGYNRPLTRNFGSDLYLLTRSVEDAPRVVVREGESLCEVGLHGTCELLGHRVVLTSAAPAGHWGPYPVARFQGFENGRVGGLDILLSIGGPQNVADGPDAPRLESLDFGPSLIMRHRKAAGNPLALASAIVMLLGLAMMGRRWAR